MGQIDRLKRITMGRIDAFLETLEKPELILPQLIQELSEKLALSARAEAKALTAVKAAQRRSDEANGKIARLESGAKLALKKNDGKTAHQMVAAQLDAEKSLQICQENLQTAQTAYQAASQTRRQLQQNLKDLRVRKRTLLAQIRTLRQKEQTSQSTQTQQNILETIARMESKVEEAEAQLEIESQLHQNLTTSFIDEKIQHELDSVQVDQRLAELKKQITLQ